MEQRIIEVRKALLYGQLGLARFGSEMSTEQVLLARGIIGGLRRALIILDGGDSGVNEEDLARWTANR